MQDCRLWQEFRTMAVEIMRHYLPVHECNKITISEYPEILHSSDPWVHCQVDDVRAIHLLLVDVLCIVDMLHAQLPGKKHTNGTLTEQAINMFHVG